MPLLQSQCLGTQITQTADNVTYSATFKVAYADGYLDEYTVQCTFQSVAIADNVEGFNVSVRQPGYTKGKKKTPFL